jgi:hypothetical protein
MASSSNPSYFSDTCGSYDGDFSWFGSKEYREDGSARLHSGGRVGVCLNDFLGKCLKDPPNQEAESWGDSSGLAVNDMQNLARESSSQAPASRSDSLSLLIMMNDNDQSSGEAPWLQFSDASAVLCGTSMEVQNEGSLVAQGEQGHSIANLEFVPFFSAAQLHGPVAGVVIGETRHAIAETSAPGTSATLKCVRQKSRKTVLEEDQVEKCPICLDSLCKGERVVTLPCFHKLHQRCCTKYFKTAGVKPICPVCRYAMAV